MACLEVEAAADAHREAGLAEPWSTRSEASLAPADISPRRSAGLTESATTSHGRAIGDVSGVCMPGAITGNPAVRVGCFASFALHNHIILILIIIISSSSSHCIHAIAGRLRWLYYLRAIANFFV